MKGKTTGVGPPDTIAVITREASRLRSLQEMRTKKVSTRVAAARADLEPVRLEAQQYLRIAEADQQKYGSLLEVIKALNLTKTDGGMWAQSVDRAVDELRGMLQIYPIQLGKAIDLIENLSSLDLDINRPQEIRSIVKRSDGASSRIGALMGQIEKGLTYLKGPPENGVKIKVDPPGKPGLPRLHSEKPNLKVIT